MQWYEYEPKPGVVNVSLPAVEAMVKWAALHRWHPLSASLLDSHHSKRDHWSNKLACKVHPPCTVHTHTRHIEKKPPP